MSFSSSFFSLLPIFFKKKQSVPLHGCGVQLFWAIGVGSALEGSRNGQPLQQPKKKKRGQENLWSSLVNPTILAQFEAQETLDLLEADKPGEHDAALAPSAPRIAQACTSRALHLLHCTPRRWQRPLHQFRLTRTWYSARVVLCRVLVED